MKDRKINRRKRRNRAKANLILCLILFVIVIYITPKFFSFARYVYNMAYEHYLVAKDFYFASDKLSLSHSEYEVTNNWSGAETYQVIVNMSSKRNDLAMTEADITYSITYTCSDNITCTLDKTSSTIVGTGNNGVNEDAFTVNINPANGTALNDGEIAWVDITASSTSPYTQTISGKLVFEVGTSDISYEIIDEANSPYLTLNIINSTSSNTNVTLSYDPTVVLLDMTSRFYLNTQTTFNTQTLNNYSYINNITSPVSALSTTSVKFFKTNSANNYSFLAGSSGTPVITLTY